MYWMLDKALDWLLDSVDDTLNLIWKLLASTLFHLPDVTGLPQVQALAARALFVVNTTYVLAIIVAGIAIMTHGSVQIRYGAGELLPRLVIGLVAANFATAICVAIIDTANTLVMALTGQGIASPQVLEQLLHTITEQLNDPVAELLAVVIGLILVVLVLALVVGWITRFIALIVLCGIAPVALACHGTPWTDSVARLWWQAMGGLCLTVILQALTLNTSLSIMLSPGANLRTFGLPHDPLGLLNLIIVAVLLAATVRIPALVRRHLTQTGGRQNIFGALVRLVIAQQVTRGLGSALRSRANAPRGAHRGSARRGSGRATGDPLRGFSAEPIPIEGWVIRDWRARQRPSTADAWRRRNPGPYRAPRSRTPIVRHPGLPDGVNPRTVFGGLPRGPRQDRGAGRDHDPSAPPTSPRRTPPPDRRHP